MNRLISLDNFSPDARPCCFLVSRFFKSSTHLIITSVPYHSIFWDSTYLLFLISYSAFILLLFCLLSSCLFLQGTVNNQTGIFPQSFVKIIKPLPESDSEGESGGPSYSCLRCFLLTPSGVDTRSV